jgi:ubiquitin-like 1-activating enzyme E1 B
MYISPQFRREHVGMSKAIVAAEVAARFHPAVCITAYLGNIKDPKYDVDFFSKFRICLSALDNVDARRHLNRMCLAAGVILLESGTTGYLGQVVPIQRGLSECYECAAKPMQKVYPICTIRSTPDKPVHCIVWAKELYKLLFGNTAESMLAGAEAEAGAEGAAAAEAEGGEDTAPVLPTSYATVSAEKMKEVAMDVARFFFISDVEQKLAAGMYQASAVQPAPLSAGELRRCGDSDLAVSDAPGWERKVWSNSECIRVLLACMVEGFKASAASGGARADFDKDSKLAMRFVTAASNLRAATFSIPPYSLYDAKGIAGNIIPAISSTNAIIAGMQVFKIYYLIIIWYFIGIINIFHPVMTQTSCRVLCYAVLCCRLPRRCLC